MKLLPSLAVASIDQMLGNVMARVRHIDNVKSATNRSYLDGMVMRFCAVHIDRGTPINCSHTDAFSDLEIEPDYQLTNFIFSDGNSSDLVPAGSGLPLRTSSISFTEASVFWLSGKEVRSGILENVKLDAYSNVGAFIP